MRGLVVAWVVVLAAAGALAVVPLGGATAAGAAGGFTVGNGVAAYSTSGSLAGQFVVSTVASGAVASTLSIVSSSTSGAQADTSNGVVSYEPPAGTTGTQSVTFQVCDTAGSCGPCPTATATCGRGTITELHPVAMTETAEVPVVNTYTTSTTYLATDLPTAAVPGQSYTASFAPPPEEVPTQDCVGSTCVTFNWESHIVTILPVPAGESLDPSSITVTGGSPNTQGTTTATYCTGSSSACTAASGTADGNTSGSCSPGSPCGGWTTTTPYLEISTGSTEFSSGTLLTFPTVSARLTATGSLGTSIPQALTEADGTANVSVDGFTETETAESWPTPADQYLATTTLETSQSVSFTSTPPTQATQGGATYTPTATASSGLTPTITVDPSSAGVCVITGGVVSFAGGGTCTLDANQSGSAGYAPAPQVQQSFPVASAAPVITAVEPSSGSTVGGTPVTITGNYLNGATTVAFGGRLASVTSDQPEALVVATPPGAAGPVDVTVTTPGGSATDAGAFTYSSTEIPFPTITGVSPATGSVTGGTLLTITGSSLNGLLAASVGELQATINYDSSTSIIVTTPSGDLGPADVSVVTPGGTAIDPGAFTYIGQTQNGYHALTPVRICDTRAGNPSGLGGEAAQCDGENGAGQRLAPGVPLTVAVAGDFGVPAEASAVVLNVTAVGGSSTGYLSAYPAGAGVPTASNLNFPAGRTVAGLVEIGLGVGGGTGGGSGAGQGAGEVSLVSNTSVDVVIDLEGYVSPGNDGTGLYQPLQAPARICDTRAGNPSNLSGADDQCGGTGNDGDPLAASVPYTVQVSGLGAVPQQGVSAVVLNVTLVDPAAAGYLSVFPAGAPAPTASNLNAAAGQTVANRVMVAVPDSGQVTLLTNQPADVVIDVSGWFTAAGGTGTGFQALAAPTRICDTRAGNPSSLAGAAAQCGDGGAGGALGGGDMMALQVTGAGLAGVPSSASAVVLELTAVRPTSPTYLSVFPGPSVPEVSDVNPGEGAVVSNLVVATLSPSGTVTIFNHSGSVDVVVDVEGWYG